MKQSDEKPTGLALMREPFPANQISKLPKPYKNDSPKGRCAECGGYHGLPAVHLDYVGHAALTDRLLNCDASWNWEPVAVDTDGIPILDSCGGMWIKLTVCGVTRLGYGDAQGKTGPNAVKERIGDALRNAAMRFGAALDLWHKGELHLDDEPAPPPPRAQPAQLNNKPTDHTCDSECVAYESEHLPALQAAAMLGNAALQAAFRGLKPAPHKKTMWETFSANLKNAANQADGAIAK